MARVFAGAAALMLGACAHTSLPSAPVIAAVIETSAVGVSGDAADDPAIWVAPDPSKSRVIGTQKQGGLFLYDLDGKVVQAIASGRPNNVDLRDGFAWPQGQGVLVATSDRADNALGLWRLDPASGTLSDTALARLPTGFAEVYGVCVGRMGADFVVAATSKIGEVGVWRVSSAAGAVTGEKIAGFALGSIAEGCVIDDARGVLYVAQELVGIWRVSLGDATGADKALIDKVGGGHLVADVEGLSLWSGPGEAGYLVASVQGASRYAVYDRVSNAYIGSFAIGPGAGVDGVSGTDGIDVVSANLGPRFPRGLMVAQDDANTDPTATQDFKYASWADVEAALALR